MIRSEFWRIRMETREASLLNGLSQIKTNKVLLIKRDSYVHNASMKIFSTSKIAKKIKNKIPS